MIRKKISRVKRKIGDYLLVGKIEEIKKSKRKKEIMFSGELKRGITISKVFGGMTNNEKEVEFIFCCEVGKHISELLFMVVGSVHKRDFGKEEFMEKLVSFLKKILKELDKAIKEKRKVDIKL